MDVNDELDNDLALVEEMTTRALEKKKMQAQSALRRMVQRLEGGPVEEDLEDDLLLLDDLVSFAPGERAEHIDAQTALKALHEKATNNDETPDADSDTD